MADESGKPVDNRPPEPVPSLEPVPVPPQSGIADNVTHDLEIALELEVKRLVDFEHRIAGGTRRAAYARATNRMRQLLKILGA